MNPSPTVGVLIRFSNSAATLPRVLEALKAQSHHPDVILGINSSGTDGSSALIENAGGVCLDWTEPYSHARVLNFGLSHLQTHLVLILSSHTVLESPDTIASMVEVMRRQPRVACVSGKWDADDYYSDAIDWSELQRKGLKFGSIYSNSMGMIRHRLWQDLPFSESMSTAEDYGWAIEQLYRGYCCARLPFSFSYHRSGSLRNHEFARITFELANHYQLKVAWPGPLGTLKMYCQSFLARERGGHIHLTRLRAWLESLFGSKAIWLQ